MRKFTIIVFYEAPLGTIWYNDATEAEELGNGGLEFTDMNGIEYTVSHRIPWVVQEAK